MDRREPEDVADDELERDLRTEAERVAEPPGQVPLERPPRGVKAVEERALPSDQRRVARSIRSAQVASTAAVSRSGIGFACIVASLRGARTSAAGILSVGAGRLERLGRCYDPAVPRGRA